MEGVVENCNLILQRMEDLEKKLLAGGNENKTNGRNEGAKACQLATSLRGEAVEVLQSLPDTQRLNFNYLYNALELRFGQKYSKDYARLQMKIRLKKTRESFLKSPFYETTGYYPSQMLFGRNLRLPADLLFSRPPDAPLAPEEYIDIFQARMEEIHQLARERIGMASENMKTRFDTGATLHDYFHEGDKVWLWNTKHRAKDSLRTYSRTGRILTQS
ncbi:retrotransposable element Tf2 protein type 2 [Trichonephila clavipes]|nr:retrotransposable element Tf2 protein type 2 [Trichonephila clavipes]